MEVVGIRTPIGGKAEARTFLEAFIDQGWRLHQSLVWVKDQMVLGHSDYHYRHESILFGYARGGGRRGRGGDGWWGSDGEDSVFEVPRPKASLGASGRGLRGMERSRQQTRVTECDTGVAFWTCEL